MRVRVAVCGTILALLVILICARIQRSRVDPPSPDDAVVGDAPVVNDSHDSHDSQFRPVQTATDGYVTSHECRECHPREHESWNASYHRTMTQLVSPDTVMSGVAPSTFTDVSHGRSYRLWWEQGRFLVRMHDPDTPDAALAEQVVRQVVMSTGSHHMQVYWYSSGFFPSSGSVADRLSERGPHLGPAEFGIPYASG